MDFDEPHSARLRLEPFGSELRVELLRAESSSWPTAFESHLAAIEKHFDDE